jgi:hypothetical protein
MLSASLSLSPCDAFEILFYELVNVTIKASVFLLAFMGAGVLGKWWVSAVCFLFFFFFFFEFPVFLFCTLLVQFLLAFMGAGVLGKWWVSACTDPPFASFSIFFFFSFLNFQF